MTEDYYKQIIFQAPVGYANHRLILDDDGNAVDYEYVEVNGAFREMTGIGNADVNGKKLSELFPPEVRHEGNLFEIFVHTALTRVTKEFEHFSESLGKWYRIHVYSPEELFFVTVFTDITKEKSQFIEIENFFSVNLDLLCIADVEGNFLKVNNSWEQVLGYKKKDLEKSKFLDFIHPDDMENTLTAISTLKNQEQVLNFINRYRTKEGKYRWIEWRSQPVGKLIYAAARDITEKIEQEELLKEQHDRFKSLFNNNPALMAVTDIEHSIMLDVNVAFLQGLGYSREEVVGRALVNEAFFENPREGEQIFHNLQTFCSFDKKEVILNRKDGSKLYGIISGECITVKGERNILIVIVDITKIKEYEKEVNYGKELLELFFKQSLDGFFFMMLDEPVFWNDDVDKDKVIDYVFTHQRITRINDAMLKQYRANRDQFIGMTPSDFFEHDLDEGRKIWKKFFDDGNLHIDTEEKRFDGSTMIIEGDYICLYDEEGRVTGHFGIQRDVSFQRLAQKQIEEEKERFRQLAENIEEVFWLRTAKEMIYISPMYEEIFGRTCESLYKNPSSFLDSVHPEDKMRVEEEFRTNQGRFNMEYRILRPDGTVRWVWARSFSFMDKTSGEKRIAGIAEDITEQKVLEEKLVELSIKDPLTGMYNRRYILERIEGAIERYNRDHTSFCTVICDIDHFKSINDNYGHLAGDFILKEFSGLLKSSLRRYDLTGRYGGEEFILILFDITKKDAISHIDGIRRTVMDMVFSYENNKIRLTFSAGVSDIRELTSKKISTDDLIDLADNRLYKAKNEGRNRIVGEGS